MSTSFSIPNDPNSNSAMSTRGHGNGELDFVMGRGMERAGSDSVDV
jgi:hypothetical protein